MEKFFIFLYFADIVESLSCIFTGIFIVGVLIFSIGGIIYFTTLGDYDDEFSEGLLSKAKKVLKWFIPFTLLAIFIPSSKTIYVYLGLKTTENVYNKLDKTGIPEKVLTIINSKLDEEIKKLDTKRKD